MDYMRLGVQEIQDKKQPPDIGFQIFKGHYLTRNPPRRLIYTDP